MNKRTKDLVKHIRILFSSGYTRKEISYILDTSYTNVCNYLNDNYIEEREFEEKIERCKVKARKVLNYMKRKDKNITWDVEGSLFLFLTLEFLDKEDTNNGK